VDQAIDLYTGRARVGFGQALARGNLVRPAMERVFEEEGLPRELAYVPLVESEFRVHARSGARACGFWQFVPRTARSLGLEQDFWVDERSDPEKATRAAALYLKHLHDVFGDWDLALAAYNAGEGTTRAAVRRTGVRDFCSLALARALPPETREYVPRIHAVILIARDPLRYGIEVPPTPPPPATHRIVVPAATDLRAVASCTGVGLEDVLALNPALRHRATPVHRDFGLELPEAKDGGVERCLAEMPEAERLGVQMHVVSAGQTLAGLARRHPAKVGDIVAANNLPVRKRLARGAELVIPKAGILVGD
jgi:membrane-bound lytic murein transglycosylase D